MFGFLKKFFIPKKEKKVTFEKKDSELKNKDN